MVIAFILGISATIIAIWYGRKSFKLTEMSFKTVMLQIESSERATLASNKRLFQEQKKLEILKAGLEENLSNKFNLKKNLAKVLVRAESMNVETWKLNTSFHDIDFTDTGTLVIKKEELDSTLDEIYLLLKVIQIELGDNELETQLSNLLDNLKYELTWLLANSQLGFNQDRHLGIDKILKNIEEIFKQIMYSKVMNSAA